MSACSPWIWRGKAGKTKKKKKVALEQLCSQRRLHGQLSHYLTRGWSATYPCSLTLACNTPPPLFPFITSATGEDAKGVGEEERGRERGVRGVVQLRAHCNVLALPAVAEEECAVNANDRRWTRSGYTERDSAREGEREGER